LRTSRDPAHNARFVLCIGTHDLLLHGATVKYLIAAPLSLAALLDCQVPQLRKHSFGHSFPSIAFRQDRKAFLRCRLLAK